MARRRGSSSTSTKATFGSSASSASTRRRQISASSSPTPTSPVEKPFKVKKTSSGIRFEECPIKILGIPKAEAWDEKSLEENVQELFEMWLPLRPYGVIVHHGYDELEWSWAFACLLNEGTRKDHINRAKRTQCFCSKHWEQENTKGTGNFQHE